MIWPSESLFPKSTKVFDYRGFAFFDENRARLPLKGELVDEICVLMANVRSHVQRAPGLITSTLNELLVDRDRAVLYQHCKALTAAAAAFYSKGRQQYVSVKAIRDIARHDSSRLSFSQKEASDCLLDIKKREFPPRQQDWKRRFPGPPKDQHRPQVTESRQGADRPRATVTPPSGEKHCFFCKLPGHLKRDCRSWKKHQAELRAQAAS